MAPVDDGGFGIEVEHTSGQAVIRVHGDLDLYSAPELWRATAPHAEPGARIVIDLGDVAFMDSQGVRVLVQAAQEVGEAGRVTVRAARPPLRKVMQITGLDRIVTISEE